jgi:hypothetical protein
MNNKVPPLSRAPVLFLVFNRLDTTKETFEAIRKAAPPKLYVASDGPRDNREGEKEKVEHVREFVLRNINWHCEVKTLLREKNLGCGKAVAEAITWFFENEEQGIILEDDCLASASFFPYCEELLNKYKDNEQILVVSGNNPLTEIDSPYSYCFVRVPHIWGWASWRRAWTHYNFEILNLKDFIKKKIMNKIFSKYADRCYFLAIFKDMEQHKIDTWDYQWTYSVFNKNGISVIPAKNLVTNIGHGADATHTLISQDLQQRFEITNIIHPEKITLNIQVINKINRIFFGIKMVSVHKSAIKKKLKNILVLITGRVAENNVL